MKFFVTVCTSLAVVVTPTSSCIRIGVVLSVIVDESDRVYTVSVSHNDNTDIYSTTERHGDLLDDEMSSEIVSLEYASLDVAGTRTSFCIFMVSFLSPCWF